MRNIALSWRVKTMRYVKTTLKGTFGTGRLLVRFINYRLWGTETSHTIHLQVGVLCSQFALKWTYLCVCKWCNKEYTYLLTFLLQYIKVLLVDIYQSYCHHNFNPYKSLLITHFLQSIFTQCSRFTQLLWSLNALDTLHCKTGHYLALEIKYLSYKYAKALSRV